MRVPAGWLVSWHELLAIDVPADGFGGDSLLYLMRHDRRLVIDVEWRPEFDPNGVYNYYVERQPLRSDPAPDYETLDAGQSRSLEHVVGWVNTWLARGAAEIPPVGLDSHTGFEPDLARLRPLRVAAGWTVERNAILEEPMRSTAATGLGGWLIFRAVENQRRMRLDVTWRAEAQGELGYCIELLHAPAPRNEHGQPRGDAPLSFGPDARVTARVTTRRHDEMVQYVELWLWRGPMFVTMGF